MKKNKSNKNFNLPEDYFEGFTDRLLDKISNMEAEQSESLLPKSDGFKVPDGYFENFTFDQGREVIEKKSKVFRLWPIKASYLAAASVAAILLMTLGIQLTATQEYSFEELAENEYETYFESHQLDLTTYEIAEVIPVDDLDIIDILDTQLNNEIIIDYLDESIDTIEELNLTDYEY